MGSIVPVFTEEAPAPLGHYSQAARGGGLIHDFRTTADLQERHPGRSIGFFRRTSQAGSRQLPGDR